MVHIVSFPPIAKPDAIILILGTMPGKRSLEEKQYYAHPQNSFWPIMGSLFDADPDLDYDTRTRALASCRIALWDVLQTCFREGSLDSSIDESSIVPNNFGDFFTRHPDIHSVFFNGSKSEQIYKKTVLPRLPEHLNGIKYIRLPSTSPAHAAMTKDEKLNKWRAIKDAI